MLARVLSAAIVGLDAIPIEVEVDIALGYDPLLSWDCLTKLWKKCIYQHEVIIELSC